MVTESHCRGLMSLNKDNFNTVSAVYSQLSTHNVHICKAAGKFLCLWLKCMLHTWKDGFDDVIEGVTQLHFADVHVLVLLSSGTETHYHVRHLHNVWPFSLQKTLTPGHSKTSEQRTVIQQCSDSYTGCWWVGCYIWYSEEGPGWAAAPPSTLLAVTNVTTHPSTAVYQLHIIRCGTVIASALLLLVCVSFTIIGQPRNSVLIHRV